VKKNEFVRILAALMALTLFSAHAVGGTFAKFTTQAVASSSARVAKWSFEVGPATDRQDITKMTFNLFEAIKDTGGEDDDAEVKGSTTTDHIIAPGTAGDIYLGLENDSEVTARYDIEFVETENKASIPMEYRIAGVNNSDWTTNLNDLKISTTDASGNIIEARTLTPNDTTSFVLQWRWQFNNNRDAADTSIGESTGSTAVEVSATITATQVD
jgi:hypothetical protein